MHNVGKIDRTIRIILALTFGVLYFTHVLTSQFFLFLSLLLLFTSLRRCCPLYAITGLGTCGIKTDKSSTIIETEKLKLNN